MMMQSTDVAYFEGHHITCMALSDPMNEMDRFINNYVQIVLLRIFCTHDMEPLKLILGRVP